jgi:DNA repair protein RadC
MWELGETVAIPPGSRRRAVPTSAAGSVSPRTRLDSSDRPREKLLARGAESLGSNELLALVLGTGTRSRSALELANEILTTAGGLRGLARFSAGGLSRLPGLGSARAARLLGALELGRRVVSEPELSRPSFRCPEDAGRFLLPRFSTRPVEEFGMLILDTRNREAGRIMGIDILDHVVLGNDRYLSFKEKGLV